MAGTLGWILQVVALGVVGAALLVGLVYGALRVEVGMLGAGALLFLIGRTLYRPR